MPEENLNPNTVSGEVSQGGGEEFAPEATPVRNWSDDFSNEFRTALESDSVQDLAGLERGYLNLRSKLGQAVFVPTPDAGEETWNKFYSRLEGVRGLVREDPDNPLPQAPRSPDEYQWEPPEGYEPDPIVGADLAKVAHEHRMSNDQLTAIRNYLTQQDVNADHEHTTNVESGINELKEDWGLAFDDKLKTSQQAVEFFDRTMGFKGELVEALNDTGAGNVPQVIKLFEILGRNLNRDPKLRGEVDKTKIDPATAEQRIADIYNNPDHPYHKGEPAALKMMQALQKARLGNKNQTVVEDLRIRSQAG